MADHVHHLRARLPQSQATAVHAWRLRLGSALGGADLRPRSLPPPAVLVVRQLAARLPAEAARPTAVAARGAWERDVRADLDARLRAAARPVCGRVPAGAEAVVFADRAEWIGCVLVAWARGERRWWWPPAWTTTRALGPLVLAEVRHVPAAVDRLVGWEAVEALGALAPSEAEAVLEAVAATFAPSVGPRGRPVRAADVPLAVEAPSVTGRGVAGEPPGLGSDATEAVAWTRAWLPAPAVHAMGASRAALLIAAVALHRRPAWARRTGVDPPAALWMADRLWTAQAVPEEDSVRIDAQARSHGPDAPTASPAEVGVRPSASGAERATAAPPVPTVDPSSASPAHLPPSVEPVEAAGGMPREAPSPASSRKREEAERARLDVRSGSSLEAPASASSSAGAPDSSDGPPRRATDVEMADVDAAADRPASVAAPEMASEPEDSTLDVGAGVETRLGGVFYLLTVFASLDVLGTFEKWQRAGALGPWALLDAIARALLPDDVALADDPLWPALALLDGREGGTRLGEGVEGDPAVVMPSDWVPTLAEDWAWAAKGGRLCVWGGAGAPVALVPRETATAATVCALLSDLGVEPARLRRRPFALAPLAPFDGPLSRDVATGVRPWLSVAVPVLRQRLAQALGGALPVEALLGVPGRLYLTSSHVDLVQPLDALPFAVRRAGLDRDPGWLPAFGRVVSFHFEGRETVFS